MSADQAAAGPLGASPPFRSPQTLSGKFLSAHAAVTCGSAPDGLTRRWAPWPLIWALRSLTYGTASRLCAPPSPSEEAAAVRLSSPAPSPPPPASPRFPHALLSPGTLSPSPFKMTCFGNRAPYVLSVQNQKEQLGDPVPGWQGAERPRAAAPADAVRVHACVHACVDGD